MSEQPQDAQPVDNGNPYRFCDHVEQIGTGQFRGCVRGAGHNGSHLLQSGPIPPQSPVLLADAALRRRVESENAYKEIDRVAELSGRVKAEQDLAALQRQVDAQDARCGDCGEPFTRSARLRATGCLYCEHVAR